MQRVTKTQLSFLGHSIRRNKDDLIPQYCLDVPAQGRSRRGRQKTTYEQHISKTIYGHASVEEKVMQDGISDSIAWCKVMKAAFLSSTMDEVVPTKRPSICLIFCHFSLALLIKMLLIKKKRVKAKLKSNIVAYIFFIIFLTASLNS